MSNQCSDDSTIYCVIIIKTGYINKDSMVLIIVSFISCNRESTRTI